MAHIVTLKDNNDEIAYPITPIDAVFGDTNTTLSEVLDEKANTDLSNVDAGSVTTAKIANGAVTANKIDWSSLIEVVGTTGNICYKFGSGLMIAVVRKTTTISYASWGGIYESEAVFPPDYAVPFIDVPECTYSATAIQLECWVGTGSGRTSASDTNGKATRGPAVVCLRGGTGAGTNTSVTIDWVAVGSWK